MLNLISKLEGRRFGSKRKITVKLVEMDEKVTLSEQMEEKMLALSFLSISSM